MKIAIVFDSQTGNTAQVAKAIQAACEGQEIISFGPPPQNVDQAELVFAGSWTDKGSCTPAMQEFLHTLYGKRVALFGTAGFGISQLYFASLADRFKGEVPKGNQVVSTFFCTGKMPQAVRDRYEAQLKADPENAKLKSMIQAYDLALTHPDQSDLEQAADFAREAMQV